jgi:urate oxidase
MGVVLGPHQYGKAEIRLVHVDRGTDRHVLRDLNISTVLRGDFAAAHLRGDNAPIVATDTQKNTAYAFAREFGIGQIERYAEQLGRHFLDEFSWVTGARIHVDEYPWARINVGGGDAAGHDHAFVKGSDEKRQTTVTIDGDDVHVVSGLRDLVVLKTTASEFAGFPRDRFTTLPETDERILATAVDARWRYAGAAASNTTRDGFDFDESYHRIRAAMLEVFAQQHSLALQQTQFEMGRAAIRACPEVAEIRLTMPNKHHFVVDLSPFGMDNPNVVFHADDRPYGKIDATVVNDEFPPAPHAWSD